MRFNALCEQASQSVILILLHNYVCFVDFIGKGTLCDAHHKEHSSHNAYISGHIWRFLYLKSKVIAKLSRRTFLRRRGTKPETCEKLGGGVLPNLVPRAFPFGVLPYKRVWGIRRTVKGLKKAILLLLGYSVSKGPRQELSWYILEY